MSPHRSSIALRLLLSFACSACVLDRSAIAPLCEGDERCEAADPNPSDASSPELDEHADAGGSGSGAGGSSDAGQVDPGQVDAGQADAGQELEEEPEPLPLAKQPPQGKLPAATGSCPEMKEGTLALGGTKVRLWMGSDGEKKLGPVVFYWHSEDAHADEAMSALGADAIQQIKQQGGIVIAPEETTGVGTSVGTAWNTGDLDLADRALACAIEAKVGIDAGRIHSVGFGSGGIMTSYMAFARSNYLASVVSFSGGLTSTWWINSTIQDATNVVPTMLVHGRMGVDFLLVDFAVTSATMASEIKQRGGFVLDCQHELNHRIPAGFGPAVLRFLGDHPYRTTPSPYAQGLPDGMPASCAVK